MDKQNTTQGNRAVNYLHNLASLLGKSAKRLTVIDRAMADAGMRRKGSGRATPQPTYEESVALLLAANTAAAPLAWKQNRKEPTVKEAPNEAATWLELPSLPTDGPNAARFCQPTLGETMVALMRDFPWENETLAKTLRIELNLTAQEAYIIFNAYPDPADYICFTFQSENTRSIEAETLVRLQGRILAYLAVSQR